MKVEIGVACVVVQARMELYLNTCPCSEISSVFLYSVENASNDRFVVFDSDSKSYLSYLMLFSEVYWLFHVLLLQFLNLLSKPRFQCFLDTDRNNMKINQNR